jgi:hypothetical protein
MIRPFQIASTSSSFDTTRSRLRPALCHRRVQRRQAVRRHLVLIFHDRVSGQLRHQFAEGLPRLGEEIQDQAHADERVAHPADARVDHAAIALTADHRPHLLHPIHHIRLADRAAVARHAEPPRHVLRQPRRGHVDDHRPFLLRQPEPRRQGKR